MASSSIKKIASSNNQTLKQLHSIAGVIILISILVLYALRRPTNYKPFIIFQIPSVACQYVIEKSGRPKYQLDPVNGYEKLVKGGSDLNQQGLFEYMFDVIYVTLGLNILMLIFGSNKVWYLYVIIPGFAVYKVSDIIMPFFKKLKLEGGDQNNLIPNANEKSKRQQKLEKNPRKQKNVRAR